VTVAPTPGITGTQLLAVLNQRLDALSEVASVTATAAELQLMYLSWLTKTAEALRRKVAHSDLEWLLASQSSWRLASISPDDWHPNALLGLIRFEVDARLDRFTAARDQLEAEVARWASFAGRLVVPDSSVFIEHPTKLEYLELADDLQTGATPLRLVVPIVVIDELDGLKRDRRNHVRWRAGYTLAVLDRLLIDGIGPTRLPDAERGATEAGALPRAEVTVEVLLDPPDHRRLPINDDEIVDRAVAVQRLAGRAVTVVTYDTGQSMRARAAGLTAVKLRIPDEDEPAEP